MSKRLLWWTAYYARLVKLCVDTNSIFRAWNRLMPRSLFERLGGWDAGYRLHAEDLDLCRRARQAGATVAIANDLQVLHVRGVSSRSRPLFVEWHKHRGLWRYFQRFEAPARRLPVRLAVWAAIWAHALLLLPRLLLRR